MNRRPRRQWRDDLALDAERTRIRHRRWGLVHGLAGISAALLIGGLVADVLFGSPGLSRLAYGGGALAAAAMLVFFYVKRLRRTRPPR